MISFCEGDNMPESHELFDMLPYQMRSLAGGYRDVYSGLRFFRTRVAAEAEISRIERTSEPDHIDAIPEPCVLVTFESGDRVLLLTPHPEHLEGQALEQYREDRADGIVSFQRFLPEIKIAQKVWEITVRPSPENQNGV